MCHSQLFHCLQNHRPLQVTPLTTFTAAVCFTSELLNTTNFICALALYRKLPELTAEDFSKIDVSQYSWIHFEASFLKPAKRHHYQTAFTHRVEVLKVTAG